MLWFDCDVDDEAHSTITNKNKIEIDSTLLNFTHITLLFVLYILFKIKQTSQFYTISLKI